MGSSDFKLEGFEALVNKMQDMGKRASSVEKTALEDGAEPIISEAKSTQAWKDYTGVLREEIKRSEVRTSKGNKFVYIGVWGVPRAYYLEYGTSKMSAKPYLGPAVANKKGEAISIVRRRIIEGLVK